MNKDPKEIMVELHEKFTNNFTEWKVVEDVQLDRTFTCLKGIAAVGELLREHSKSKHHEICCKIYDEIFSDGASALYLASTSMDKPANIVLRRVLELGVAALYLWDMPHMAHSWNSHDQDLSFTEMLNHINSKGYLEYVNIENSIIIDKELLPGKRLQKIYGDLSDIVHGKITTFESSMPDRFKFVEREWLAFIELIEEILEILLKAVVIRYDFKDMVFIQVPQLKKELNL
ncbi:hypothetical protein AB6D22_09200 [Vibrio splendidus]|uniref:hypothetical protein n=1 Tax=Vibrio splendidus TaxID=29497 RepID=UPI000C864009|nr:hypothetical protein [Vibrio splendidus]PMG61103.1 hypothetical protein BCU88_10180 [Vibrio splendidus]